MLLDSSFTLSESIKKEDKNTLRQNAISYFDIQSGVNFYFDLFQKLK